MMLITEDEGQIAEITEYMKSLLPKSVIEDYITNPKPSGYRSLHMNDRVAATDINMQVPTEVQIKTAGMYVAQEATHETIYKNDSLKKEKKDELSAVLSPVMELLLDIEREGKRGNFDRALELENRRKELLESNSELLGKHKRVVDTTWKEYAKVRFKLENNTLIENESFLKVKIKNKNDFAEREKVEQEQKRKAAYFDKIVGRIYNYYYANAQQGSDNISGDARVDYAIRQLKKIEYAKFKEILNRSYDEEEKSKVSTNRNRGRISSKTIISEVLGREVKKSDVDKQEHELVKAFIEDRDKEAGVIQSPAER